MIQEVSKLSIGEHFPLNTPNTLELDEIEQTLLHSEPELPAYFTFRWSDIQFEAEVKVGNTGPFLHLTAELAPIPFTAEQGERRKILKSLCDPRVRLEKGHFFQSKRQWIGYSVKYPITTPVTGAQILETTAETLLIARTYFAVAKEPELIGQEA
jgi:hypothetical protein